MVVTDLRLRPGHSDEGIAIATELRHTHPQMGVVVLSDAAEPHHAATLFAGGSYRRAFLLKERLADSAELERAVEAVAAGGAVVDPRVVDELLSSRSRRERSPLGTLTPRELEILGLIAEGRANGGIAVDLGITKRGVERHVNAIFAKLERGASDEVSRRVKAALIFLGGEGRLVPGARG